MDTNISNINIIVDDQNIMVSGSNLVIFGSPDLPNEVEIYINDGELTNSGTLKIKLNLDDKKEDMQDSIGIYLIIILLIVIATILGFAVYTQVRRRRYQIDEIFLIHNSGKLLNHMLSRSHSRFDDEIFSGMFTAIQEFIEDTFAHDLPHLAKPKTKVQPTVAGTTSPDTEPGKSSEESSVKLNEFKVGENQVIIEHGNYVYMAVVYTGPGAVYLHREVKRCIRLIEKRYRKHLPDWDGDMLHFKTLKQYLLKIIPKSSFIESANNIPENEQAKKRPRRQVKAVPVKRLKS